MFITCGRMGPGGMLGRDDLVGSILSRGRTTENRDDQGKESVNARCGWGPESSKGAKTEVIKVPGPRRLLKRSSCIVVLMEEHV
jgi:hypothetical protein